MRHLKGRRTDIYLNDQKLKQTISFSEKEKNQMNAVRAIFIHDWVRKNGLSGSERSRKRPEEEQEEVNDNVNNGCYQCGSLKPFRPCGTNTSILID